MSLFDILAHKKPTELPVTELKDKLDDIQEMIETHRGIIDLDAAYNAIGKKLLSLNIVSLFTLYDKKRKFVLVKHYYFPNHIQVSIDREEEKKLFAKPIPLENLEFYRQSILTKKPIYRNDRQSDTLITYPLLIGDAKKMPTFNSILIPLILDKEVIGTMEAVSPSLSENHIDIFIRFAADLMRDIANKVLFNEIKSSEEKYRNLFENAEDGFLIFNRPELKFTESNLGIRKITGYTNDELVQLKYLKLFHQADRRSVENFIKSVTDQSNVSAFKKAALETRLITKGGEIKFVNLKINHIAFGPEWFFIVNDITARKQADDKLRESEERYRQLIDGAKVGMVVADNKGAITFVNEAFMKIFGYEQADLVGRKLSKLIYKEDLKPLKNFYRTSLAGKKRPAFDLIRGINKNGGITYNEYSATKIVKDGKATEVMLVFRDVTENRILQQKILDAKLHYERVIDTLQDGLCVIDKNFTILSYNLVFAQRVKMSLTELKGIGYYDVIGRYEKNILKNYYDKENGQHQIIEKSFETGLPYEIVAVCGAKNKPSYYYKICTFPARNENNEIDQVVIVIRNITEHRRAEMEVQRLSKFNQRILDTAPVSITVLNRRGNIIAANEAARKLLAGQDKPISGTNLFATKEIAENKYLLRLYKKLISHGESFYYDNLCYTSGESDEKNYFNIIAVPLYDKDKKVEGVLSMALDNTEAVRAKQKLEELNRNLEWKVAERTKELDITNHKLNKALDLKMKFIADASHELRTPLTVIQGNLDLAIREKENYNQEVPELYSLMMHEVERMRTILTDLTILTNIDSDNEQMRYEKVDLAQIVKAVAQSLQILADQKDIKLSYKRKAKKVRIMGDEAKLEKLVLNIVRNGIKYTNPKGRIKIWTKKFPDEAVVIVQDNGIGIPEKDLPNIFERFYRVDKARSRQEGGSGIGLSIAKWIAEAHGGGITVESEPGKGSKFTIHLPHDFKK